MIPFLLSFLFLSVPVFPQSEVYIKLAGQGQEVPPLPLGLPSFVAVPSGHDEVALAQAIRGVVRSDLLFSRRFTLTEDGHAYSGSNEEEIIPSWKERGGAFLYLVRLEIGGGRAHGTARLIDLNSGEPVFEHVYAQETEISSGSTAGRALAHKMSNDIILAVTGKQGIAESRIAFVNDSSGHKEIYIMDYDGANLSRLTHDHSIDLLPRFSPDRSEIVYTSYRAGNPDLYVIDLIHDKTRPLSTEQGLNIAGGFSPDGKQIVLTMSRGGSPNLYLKNFPDGSPERLTNHWGADSSPTFSPDANEIAFVSDRAGNPQIFIMDLTTHRTHRLTNLNWCDSPAWSPTGEWIAFSGRVHNKDKLDIFLVDITGNQIRQITHGEGSNENPTWSPDGRFIAFSSTRDTAGAPKLHVMDADGSAPHKIGNIPGSSLTPTWSK